MGEVSKEISNAIKENRFTAKQINKLDGILGKRIYDDLLNHFVKSGDRRWWWEDFKVESFNFKEYEKPFEHLNQILIEFQNNVWLMVEDDQEEFYPIYDCSPAIVGKLIGDCFGFEYYLIDKNKEWLICENHHNRLIGIGEKLKDKNRDRLERNTKA